MATPSDFQVDSTRDATDSIRGYVYQAYQSVLAWMRLDEHEILILEGAEDFDIHRGRSVTTTQVKDVAGSLTLRQVLPPLFVLRSEPSLVANHPCFASTNQKAVIRRPNPTPSNAIHCSSP